jgi:hypothetical protein
MILMAAAVIGLTKTFPYVAGVAPFSVVAGLLYGAWVDGVNRGWIGAGLLAFMGALATQLRWMLGRRAALGANVCQQVAVSASRRRRQEAADLRRDVPAGQSQLLWGLVCQALHGGARGQVRMVVGTS